jgi:hypothetical protein
MKDRDRPTEIAHREIWVAKISNTAKTLDRVDKKASPGKAFRT